MIVPPYMKKLIIHLFAVFMACVAAPLVFPAQLASISTRALVGTGDAISITEFVIQGSASKKVLIRGIGPSLPSWLANRLQDPILELLDRNGARIATNDNWKDTQQSEIEASTLAPTNDLESAILVTLNPGMYSITERGKNGTTGIGLIEVYDFDQQNSTITAIGSRAQVNVNPNEMVSGVILAGDQPQQYLVRALGPSMTAKGVTGCLANPTLEIRTGNGDILATNDNWQDTQRTEIIATNLAPSDPYESAIVTSLPGGSYTAIVTGAGGTIGIGFVQFYALPYSADQLNPSPLRRAPPRFEVERLPVQALTGATHSLISDTKLSEGAGTQLNATGTGQSVSYAVPVPDAGTYKIKVGVKTGPKRGTFRLSIGGVNQGKAQDEYTSTIGYSVRDLGTITFFSGGNKAFKFLVSGKNANSGGYNAAFDYIELIPTNRLETEALKVQSVTPVPSGFTTTQWYGVFNAAAASGSAGTYFNANALGNYITYTLPVAKAGTYHVRVGLRRAPNEGIFRLAINGVNQGQPQDEYSSSVTYVARDLGTVYLNSGNQAFKFFVTGKNANSTGYNLRFDYIELVP